MNLPITSVIVNPVTTKEFVFPTRVATHATVLMGQLERIVSSTR